MKLEYFPNDIKDYLIPKTNSGMAYQCLNCQSQHKPDKLHYVCPKCNGLLLLIDLNEDRLKEHSGEFWQKLFDFRKLLNKAELKGIFTFHEFLAPIIPLENIIYLGEGHTPVVKAPQDLAQEIGNPFYIKHDGQNPSASFKDRGMAAALSYLNYLIESQNLKDVLAICASTGDTSAAAALYASRLGHKIKSAVILPKGKVTMAQLSQPLGAGAKVFELPGVFDDCMKVVEHLSNNYEVALLNSKNPWRVVGQESYAYEVAQQFDYNLKNKALIVPVGNAGNITAILSGLLKFYKYGVIKDLPKIIAVQSEHANPVFLYYNELKEKRKYKPVTVQPSVAQAAMIGDPVSFPRVLKMVEAYENLGGIFYVVNVQEQDIMDSMLQVNRRGFTVCTQGGEGVAGLKEAVKKGFLKDEEAIIDSTAHALKFSEFQNAYFEDNLQEGFKVKAKKNFINIPQDIIPQNVPLPQSGISQTAEERSQYVNQAAKDIAKALGLKTK